MASGTEERFNVHQIQVKQGGADGNPTNTYDFVMIRPCLLSGEAVIGCQCPGFISCFQVAFIDLSVYVTRNWGSKVILLYTTLLVIAPLELF